MAKVIVHIDLNCFFATCEEIIDPTCVGKPMAVAGNSKRGIVSTANYEARKYGVHSAMPTYMAKRMCPNLIIKDHHFDLYVAKSKEFFSFVKKYTPIIEIASIDECFADFTEVIKDVKDPLSFFKNMQMDLFKKTQLKCSMGISINKFLAKMGSDMKKPMGITIIRKKDIEKMLYPLPIDDMFGVGKKTAPRLKKLGIKTIGDLANNSDEEVIKTLGKFYYVLQDWAHGIGDDNIVVEPPEPKSLGHSQTLYDDTNDFDELKALLSNLCSAVAKEAKFKKKKGTTVQVVIKDFEFKTINRSITLDYYFNDYETIYNYALKLLEKNLNGTLVRLIGVTLQNLVDEKEIVVQMTFNDYGKYEDENRTKLLINEFNRITNSNVFMRASEAKKKDK